jgi:O-antigen ligase
MDHLWTGTGTVVPTQVPDRLTTYFDNEYLRMGLRGGIFGEALLLLLLASVAVAGWRSRGSPRPLIQVLGALALTSAVFLGVLGTSADYLSYPGVSQLFWIIVGLLGGSVLSTVAASWQGRQPNPGITVRPSS